MRDNNSWVPSTGQSECPLSDTRPPLSAPKFIICFKMRLHKADNYVIHDMIVNNMPKDPFPQLLLKSLSPRGAGVTLALYLESSRSYLLAYWSNLTKYQGNTVTSWETLTTESQTPDAIGGPRLPVLMYQEEKLYFPPKNSFRWVLNNLVSFY